MSLAKDDLLLFDFDDPEKVQEWYAINDVVMGGVSNSRLEIEEDGTGVFLGRVSLENNGGFASVRKREKEDEVYDLGGYDGVALRIRGDGKSFKFTFKTAPQFDSVVYQHRFETKKNEWKVVNIPFKEFIPTYHGRVVKNAPQLDPHKIKTFGFLISEKQEGSFRLEIDWIKAYKVLEG